MINVPFLEKYNKKELTEIENPFFKDIQLSPKVKKEEKTDDKMDIVDNVETKVQEDEKNGIVLDKKRINLDSIDSNYCIVISGIDEKIKLEEFKKYLTKFQNPLFVDLNRKENKAILRFGSKFESEIFCNNFHDANLNQDWKKFSQGKQIMELNALSPVENANYLSMVKKEKISFKLKKIGKKFNKFSIK